MLGPVVHNEEQIKCLQNEAEAGRPHRLPVVQFGVVQFIKHAAVNHLPLPLRGDCACVELPEEFLILGIKLYVVDLRGVSQLLHVLRVDHVGFWHPGGLHQPGLQTMEGNVIEKGVASWVTAARVKKIQQVFND